MTSVFLQNTCWRHGHSRCETKYSYEMKGVGKEIALKKQIFEICKKKCIYFSSYNVPLGQAHPTYQQSWNVWNKHLSIKICDFIYFLQYGVHLILVPLPQHNHLIQNVMYTLSLIPRTTVTSLSAPKDTRCKTHPLSVNPGVPFWTREKLHKLYAWWHPSSSEYTRNITVVLDVRQSIVI